MKLLSDISDDNLGINRIWEDRKAWQRDKDDGPDKWRTQYIANAFEIIQMQSNTLWNNWLTIDDFPNTLRNCLKNSRVQIFILHPDSETLTIRAKDEMKNSDRRKTMQIEICNSLARIYKLLQDFPNNLEIKLSKDYMFLSQIIRADKRMLVTIYLSGKLGWTYPTIQILNSCTNWFTTYNKQFIINWDRSIPISPEDIKKLLEKYKIGNLL